MGVKDYDLNPDNNTQISGINIAEGCPPSGINNAMRQLMADVKEDSDAQNTAIETLKTKAETPASSEELGPVKVGTGLNMDDGGVLSVNSSVIPSPNKIPQAGADGTILPDWISGILKTTGGKVDGEIAFGTGYAIRRDNDTGALIISGGTSYDSTDGMIVLHGKSDASPGLAGLVELMAGGARVSVGVNGIYYPNDHRVMFNKDIFIQAVSPNGPVYRIPDGGTWNFTRLQWDIDGNIAEASTQTVAGGIEANISNENAQFLIAYRVSM